MTRNKHEDDCFMGIRATLKAIFGTDTAHGLHVKDSWVTEAALEIDHMTEEATRIRVAGNIQVAGRKKPILNISKAIAAISEDL